MRLIHSLVYGMALAGTLLNAQQAAPPDTSPAFGKRPASTTTVQAPMQPDSDLPPCPATNASNPETERGQKTAGETKPPKPIFMPNAEFSDESRKMMRKQHLKTLSVTSLIGLVVGVDGLPHDLCLKGAAGWGLDRQAAIAVRQYRFKPATRNGEPVAVPLSVEVHFQTF